MSNFWDILTLIVSTFIFVAYLMVMFHIVFDLFRDSELGGGIKALWIAGLIFLPVLTALVYIIARGPGMAQRQRAAAQRMKLYNSSYLSVFHLFLFFQQKYRLCRAPLMASDK